MLPLDALPCHVAVLDHVGGVAWVNAAWRAFGASNGLVTEAAGVGANYLAICDRAEGPWSDEAQQTAAGIRHILAGEGSAFVVDYPCHSPDEARWFRLTVSPLTVRGQRGALVMHVNVTGPEENAVTLRTAERVAHESERRLSFALDATGIGDWSLDLRTNAAYRSLRHDQCFGYHELLPTWSYDTFLAHILEDDRARVDAGFQTAMAGKGEYNEEFRTRWADGTTHWLWTRGRFYFDEVGQPYRVAGVVMDISERKESERAVARALERLTEAQRIGQIGDWEWDADTNRIDWSAQVFALMGRDVVLGPPASIAELEQHFDERSVAIQQAAITAAFATGDTQEYELTVKHPDGARTDLFAVAVPRFGSDGRVTGLYGTVQDITDRKRAQEAQARLASIVASSDDAIIGKGLDSIITSWNRGAQKLFGYTEAEIVGTSMRQLIPDDRQEEELRLIERIRNGESMESMETVRVRKDGTYIDVSITSSPLRDPQGRVVGVSTVARDISERRRLEQRFLRAQRMESIGTLAGGIAHDLNNVLQPILLSLEILRESFPDPDSQHLLSLISRSAHHGADMVKQVLSFARGVEGERVSVDVRSLVTDIGTIARDTFLKNIEIVTHCDRDLWTVVGDVTQLHQVILNLCVNARDAMPQGGVLTLSAENVQLDEQYAGLESEAGIGPYVCVTVTDSGVGMTSTTLNQIFDPFFTTKEVGRGTGLGLSTSQAITRSHGGFIRVYSEPGRGSSFSVYLPAQPTTPSAAASPVITLPRGHNELILVVDDEPSVRQITQHTLEAFGYRVLVASDGAEAVALYAQRCTDIALVLTDMTMPIMDGAATIQVLRRVNPAVSIIATSGLDVWAQVANLSVEHVLTKPFGAATLLTLLAKVLGHHEY